jgi:WD40 repeat protein
VVFSADGQHLASGSDDKTVKIWDRASGDCLQTLEGHSSRVSSVVFSADGQHLASGSGDDTVKIWDRASGDCLQTLHVGRPLYRLSFDPTDSNRLSTEIGVLNLETPSLAAHVNVQMTGETIPQPVSYVGVGLSNNGVWVMKDEEIMLWLPPGYRSEESAVVGGEIAIGCRSGRMLMMKIS